MGKDTEQKLCRELCVKDVASQITCHTLHLNKAAVFTLTSLSSKKVVKSVIDATEREVAVNGGQDEIDDVSVKFTFC